MAQRFLHAVFSAFARSPQWHRGLFVVTYDEWGGFFDHVAPPVVADDRASKVDARELRADRVPGADRARVAVRAARATSDSTQYDHTSILRFLEWRFLGAPPAGVDATNGRWYLTKRDRAAHNLGNSLVTAADPELDFELDGPIPIPSDGCRVAEGPAVANELGPSDVPAE